MCDELVIVSRCLYGSFSAFVQRVLERTLPYLTPFYVNGSSMRHKKRYHNRFSVSAYFYGEDLSEMEKKEARIAVQNVCDELGGVSGRISFTDDVLAIGGLS